MGRQIGNTQMDKWVDRRMAGWVDKKTDRWTDGWVGGQTYEWVDR
jgi:hypothetical protein